MGDFGADAPTGRGRGLSAYFFDVLHAGGDAGRRRAARRPPGAPGHASCRRSARLPSIVTADPVEAAAFLDRADRRRPRGRDGQVARRALRRRPAGRGVAQDQAGPHARPRRAGRRVGSRPAHRVAVQPAPRRPGRRRRVRDGRQDVQGADRRAAALADRGVPGDRRRHRGRLRRARAAGDGRRDRPRRRAGIDPLPGRRGPAVRPRQALPTRQVGRRRRPHRPPSRRCCADDAGSRRQARSRRTRPSTRRGRCR